MQTEPQTKPRNRRPGQLPPGQREIDFFPRIGRRADKPPPVVGEHPTVRFGGVLGSPIEVAVADLVAEERRDVTADFHCVAGWSYRGLHWEGVSFAATYRRLVEPLIPEGTTVTHVRLTGLDGERFDAELDDLLAEDVLIADRLNGEPLDAAHGAPARIVSPAQYGYANIKHLASVDFYDQKPEVVVRPGLERLIEGHARARVWEEERHASLPSWFVRPIYRAIKHLMLLQAKRAAKASR